MENETKIQSLVKMGLPLTKKERAICLLLIAAAAILPPEDIEHHNSDLYIRWSTAAKNLLVRLSCKSLLTTFRDGRDYLWYELPFCYNPTVGGKQ